MGRAGSLPFIQYLQAKTTVDDRALNRHVLSTLQLELRNIEPNSPLNILEIGAGIGTMIMRLHDWQILPSSEYTAVDIDPELTREGRRQLGRYALKNSLAPGCGLAREILLQSEKSQLSVDFVTEDGLEYCQRESSRGRFDLLIAHAFMDLVDLPTAIPILLDALEPSGLFYFTLVFDGVTHFEPPIDPALDVHIESLYHQTMEERSIDSKPSGDPHSGRHLLGGLLKNKADILAAGASDWLVHPTSGRYPAQEAQFLHHILNTIEDALKGGDELDQDQFSGWLQKRREQVDSGDLVYLAHQIDILGRRNLSHNPN
ncbi:MAG: class I SAM-dependent methyltransferase [Anaerolineales bacterium]|jgi:SAM-dependent methyltransferase